MYDSDAQHRYPYPVPSKKEESKARMMGFMKAIEAK